MCTCIFFSLQWERFLGLSIRSLHLMTNGLERRLKISSGRFFVRCGQFLALTVLALGVTLLKVPKVRADAVSVSLGFDADVVPYILEGSHGDIWLGFSGWRVRVITAYVPFPRSFAPAGFKDLTETISEVEVDRFFGSRADQYLGTWAAVGAGDSITSIKSSTSPAAAHVRSDDLHAGLGYSAQLMGRFYISPWIGFVYHETIPGTVTMGTQHWHPESSAFEAGLKFGWSFGL